MPQEPPLVQPLARLYPGLSLRPGARSMDIEVAERAMGRRLPTEYRQLLSESNGFEGFLSQGAFVMLWPVGDLGPLNSEYETSGFAPGLLLVGTDGGGTGYGIVESATGFQFVRIPLVGMSMDAIELLGATSRDFLQRIVADANGLLARELVSDRRHESLSAPDKTAASGSSPLEEE